MITITIDERILSEHLKAPIKRHVSFSSFLKNYIGQSSSLRKEREKRAPAFFLDSKIIAHDFARRMGIHGARIRSVNKKLIDLNFLPNTFFKPVYESCARGVFFVDAEGQITHLNGYEKFSGRPDAEVFATQLLREGVIKKDAWIEEDLISGMTPNSIARDIKFYMFYGQVGLVLETQRQPDLKRCWYNKEGEVISVGKYDNLRFEGTGQFEKARDIAVKLSLAIPAPFVRIDFLLKGEDVYFGEITPAPSGFDELDHATDSRLGAMFVKASTRLSYDLIYGKSFSVFKETVKSAPELVGRINRGAYYTEQTPNAHKDPESPISPPSSPAPRILTAQLEQRVGM